MAVSTLPSVFEYTFRVRYAEVDPQSVVFNSRYLEYADLMITEYWREAGLHFYGEGALEFHVVRAEVDFVQPIRADEMITGRAQTIRIGNSSVTTAITLHGEGARQGDGEAEDLRARINLVHVHVDLESGKATPIPDGARTALVPAGDQANG